MENFTVLKHISEMNYMFKQSNFVILNFMALIKNFEISEYLKYVDKILTCTSVETWVWTSCISIDIGCLGY